MFIYHNVLVPSVPIHYGKKILEKVVKETHMNTYNILKYKNIDMQNISICTIFFLTKMSMDRSNVIGMIINNMLFKNLNKNRRLKI